jgi:hypothetical protein
LFPSKNPILKKRSPLKKQNNSRFLKSVFNSQQIHTNLYIHTKKVNKIKKKCHTRKKTSLKIY